MSKTLYMQQLGRGMRKCEGKEYLLVFDFITNPFKRFEDMRFMKRCREIEFVEFNRYVFKKLTREDIAWIKEYCDSKLEEYYARCFPSDCDNR